MTEAELTRKIDEIDRLLNDPDAPIDPARIWALLAETAGQFAHGDEPAANGATVAP